MFRLTVLAVVLGLFVGVGHVKVVIETVPVGNLGNPDDVHGAGYGGVDYAYRIGKYEVTAGQYVEFLNAVATPVDTYGLYDDGIMMIHTGTGTLSTPMTEAEIDRLAEAVLASLRKVKERLLA